MTYFDVRIEKYFIIKNTFVGDFKTNIILMKKLAPFSIRICKIFKSKAELDAHSEIPENCHVRVEDLHFAFSLM